MFYSKVYSALIKVPSGKVITYKVLGSMIGSTAYRAIGTAMRRNENAPQVPCHRVVLSSGKIGGYSGGVKRKISMLKKEGVIVVDGMVKEFEMKLWV